MKKTQGTVAAASLVPLALGLASATLTKPSSAETTQHAKDKVACAPALLGCPEIGCAKEGSADAVTNALKRRIPDTSKSPRVLSLEDFKALQDDEIAALGDDKVEPTEVERTAALRNLKVAGGRVSEGDLVEVVGFLVGKAHANSGESVNCKLTGVANNDFHITISDDPTNDEFAGIVVEMTPQTREKGWTLKKLNDVEASGKPVLVVGQLFYDNKHHINADADNPTDGDPKRFSLFEVHPITGFSMCVAAELEKCDPKRASDWTPLANVTP